jgi:hypothetical protein
MKTSNISLSAIAVLAATLVHAQAAIITNGNFADGLTGWTSTTTAFGDPQTGNYNSNGWLAVAPPEGNTIAVIGGGATNSVVLSQSLPTLAIGTYTLSFASAGIADYFANWAGQNTWNPSVLGIRATVTSGSTVLYDSGFTSTYQQDWEVYSGNFTTNSTVNDAVVNIAFENTTYETTGSHAYIGVSNVSLVPEPSSFVMLLGGIGAFVIRRRRVA